MSAGQLRFKVDKKALFAEQFLGPRNILQKCVIALTYKNVNNDLYKEHLQKIKDRLVMYWKDTYVFILFYKKYLTSRQEEHFKNILN